MIKHFLLWTACGLFAVTAAQSSDLAKEERWAAQIVDSLMDGDAVYLDDGRSQFLALEMPASDGNTKRGAVVMHGTGVHPNWPTVVLPLRVGLAEDGWHTLSIQMPVLPNDADYKDYPPLYGGVPGRIDAAIDHLKDQGVEKVVLVAHSQGATMATYYLANTDRVVDGFVAIGMGPGIAGTAADNLAHLPRIKVPLFDLYGSEDLPEVLASAGERADAARGNGEYSQAISEGADHFFDGEETALVETVQAWLDNL